MKIELTEEETEFLLRICTRAKLFTEMGIMKHADTDMLKDKEKI